jgi:3-hydroxybutyryl-CoA dehydrogenase
VFIVGEGLMGSGVTQACAQSGLNVVINDITQEAIEKGIKSIAWSVAKFIEKRKLSEDIDTILNRIAVERDFTCPADADLAMEAVFENSDLKQEIFMKLDESCPAKTILVSNTSPISISELASGRKMGPFEIGDTVGLDVTYNALMSIYETTRGPYWYPLAIMRHKVKAGHLGRKTGKR